MTKQIDLKKLEEADPRAYLELLNKAGYHDEALNGYVNSNNPENIYHAAELAFDLKKYDLVKELLGRADKESARRLKIAEESAHDVTYHQNESGLMGASISFWNSQESHKKLLTKISQMELKLASLSIPYKSYPIIIKRTI